MPATDQTLNTKLIHMEWSEPLGNTQGSALLNNNIFSLKVMNTLLKLPQNIISGFPQ